MGVKIELKSTLSKKLNKQNFIYKISFITSVLQ